MRPQILRLAALAGVALMSPVAHGQAAPTMTADAEADYTLRIAGRSDRLIAKLGPIEPARAADVRRVLRDQYRAMRALHDARDARLAALATDDPAPAARIAAEADVAMAARRRAFDAELARHLPPGQVERVKDLLTFDMVPLSMGRMATMYPGLTVPQKARLRAYLVDARDLSLDAGSAEERLDAFRIGRIRMDRYLVYQGYDVKKANAAWDEHLAERKAAEAATTRPAS